MYLRTHEEHLGQSPQGERGGAASIAGRWPESRHRVDRDQQGASSGEEEGQRVKSCNRTPSTIGKLRVRYRHECKT